MWSKEHLGYIATQTYWTQKYVVTKQVQKWIKAGYSDGSVALLYNHPASKGVKCGRGYNEEQGVKWDSCHYREMILARL